MKSLKLIIIIIVILLIENVLIARPVSSTKLSSMWKNADLVVVIKPESTELTDDKLTSTGPKYGKRNPNPKNYQGLTTTCKVMDILKKTDAVNNINDKILKIIHFYYTSGPLEFNGGLFMYFHLPPTILHTKPAEKQIQKTINKSSIGRSDCIYLAFLRKRKDGRFEPITRNYYSASSFRILSNIYAGQAFFAIDGVPKNKKK